MAHFHLPAIVTYGVYRFICLVWRFK